ncbi:MAG: cyclic nucleotide-binding domain-containing protein [Alphaproteobacteria bacterium]|nr:cyclic nucleotide-binding domain-containing protein [Alphaproteobacteria bacterium]
MNKGTKVLNRRFVPAGQLVIEQGCIGNRAFLIEQGKVEVFVRDKSGRNVKIAEVAEGSIIGEMALIDGGMRSASIRTMEDCVLVAISAEDIKETIGQKDGLFSKMMQIMVERLKETNAKLMQQNLALSEIEEQAQMTVKNVALHIPEGKQAAFKKEMLPLLDNLKTTLNKYNRL